MSKVKYSPTERIGVSAVEHAVASELRWIFREQPIVDMGIDAHIEQVDESGGPTGKLIGVQIKTGPSQVTRAGGKYVYYGDLVHLHYWLSHSLPVILVVHIPGEGTYWQAIDESTVVRTPKAWKTEIPVNNVLAAVSKDALQKVFEGTPKQQRQRRLALDESLMRHIAAGGKVVVEMEDWVNKSLGRTPVNIYVIDASGDETSTRAFGLMYTGYKIKQVAQRLFPWAEIHIDEEFYEENAPEETERELLSRLMDLDHGMEHEKPSSKVIRPYDEHGGEVETYRLQLKLNDVGNGYLAIADYSDMTEDEWARRDEDEDDFVHEEFSLRDADDGGEDGRPSDE